MVSSFVAVTVVLLLIVVHCGPTDNQCEHFWSGYCFSVIMCVARCLLSWLLFAATTDFLRPETSNYYC